MPSTVNKSDVSRGLTSQLLARAMVVQVGHDAALSTGNVRHPAAAQALRYRLTVDRCRQVGRIARPSQAMPWFVDWRVLSLWRSS